MSETGELGMVGTTFRRAGARGLAYYTLPPQQAQELLGKLHAACGCAQSVYLATCNRVEFFFACGPQTTVACVRQRFFTFFAELHATRANAEPPFDEARRLHAFAGEGAVERLFVVAAALDSMVPGEAQILGQVKSALALALELRLAGSQLKTAFEAAFSAAKRVRQHTALGLGRTSMLSLTLHAIAGRLAQSAPHPSQAVIVGAGDMAEQCGRALQQKLVKLVFVNRSLAPAQDLARRFTGEAMSLPAYIANPPPTDVMITATASPDALFAGAFFERMLAALHERRASVPNGTFEPPLAVDLAVPPDIDSVSAAQYGITLYDVDRMQATALAHSARRQDAVGQARQLLDDALDQYRIKEAERAMGHAIATVRAHGQDALAQQLLNLREALPPDVVAAGWPHIERFARGLFGQLAHTSTRGLKALAHDHGPEALGTYLRGAGLHEPNDALPGSQVSKNLRGPQ